MEYSPIIKVNGVELSPQDYSTSLGYVDPRETPGELLFKTRFDAEVVAQLKKDLGPIAFAGQYNQSPIAEGGNKFKRAWFVIEETAPARFRTIVRYWDKAGTTDAGCFTVGALLAEDFEGAFWLLDIVRGQWADAEREAIILQTAKLDNLKYGRALRTWVEQEPGSSGKDIANQTIKKLKGYNIEAERPTGDKVARAGPLASQAAGGNVKLLLAAWNKTFLDEAEVFPNGPKDQIDATSGAFNRVAATEMTAAEKMKRLAAGSSR
jgi:predicted phage terminase large subunit-like protein